MRVDDAAGNMWLALVTGVVALLVFGPKAGAYTRPNVSST
jgi:hypothetical protein